MKSEFCVAVHALVYLNHKKQRLTSEALADNVCTNPARIRKVMAALRKAGLIDAREGAEGGYGFFLDPSAVTLRDVLRATGEKLMAPGWRSGDKDRPCLVASGMSDIMDGIFGELNLCAEERLSRITIADIDRKIFAAANKE